MHTQAEQPHQQHQSAEAAILAHAELDASIDPDTFIYDQQFGGLVQPQEDDSVRLLMFRAHSDPAAAPQVHTTQAAEQKRLIPKVNDTFYGTGTYLGSTPQSVAVYGLKPGRQVSVFLTPPIRLEDVADRRGSSEQSVTAPRRLGQHVAKSVVMRLAKSKTVGAIDTDYGDAKLAIQDMGPDAYAMQKALTRRHTHPVKPAWYVWRLSPDELERVGSASVPVMPNLLGRAALSSKAK